ncbi:aspartyl/asparaginyl beta-hydroxylase-like isoform X3 [Dromiciops gliroides]|uniref:aspartyl/asparaginyl beta-hydroxylase-like isoform X3 n=1 Tax=Dromiciops gliroides TaxID=33562 RepID=UPI001CC70654|nr:aspartyl/asparaginyl beta-hydroxylase-like isoform X3 [Dromiciops gliroides]
MNEDKETKHGGHKNGKKEGLSGSSFFTWFMVIALLGVWTSVAVVWFDLVDYEEVLAKAKDFRYNLSEVLQGKLGIYDADGDGDFDVDDAKVLLEEPGGVAKRKAKAKVKEVIKEELKKVKEKPESKKESKNEDKKKGKKEKDDRKDKFAADSDKYKKESSKGKKDREKEKIGLEKSTKDKEIVKRSVIGKDASTKMASRHKEEKKVDKNPSKLGSSAEGQDRKKKN